MNILIIKLGAIGDVIRTTSILPGLKEKYEGCKIDWVAKKESYDILKNNNFLRNIFVIGKDEDVIKCKEYDLVISFDDEESACQLASEVPHKKIVGAHIKDHKKAYAEDSAIWFDMGLISKLGKKRADELKARNKKTYQEIKYKILGLRYKKQEPILILSEEELQFGKTFADKNNIKNNDLAIGINTGAGGRWQDKKLSIDETSELIDKINGNIKNAKLLLFGGPEEAERNRKIKEKVKSKIIDAGCNNSLMEFASLVNLCNILVTSDSLALHIGTALKKKVVSLYYPTSMNEIETYGRGIKIRAKGKDYCSYKPKCDHPAKWDIDEIADAVKRLV